MDMAMASEQWDVAQWKRHEQVLRERAEFIELLGYVSVAANEARDVTTALGQVLEQVCRHHDLVIGHALVVETPGTICSSGIWYIADARSEGFRAATEQVKFPAGVGLPGRVLESAQPAWIEDVTLDTNFPRAGAAQAVQLKAAFAFPVLVGMEVVAVLEFFSTVAAPPQPLLLEVMGHVGAQLGRVFERQQAAEALCRGEERLRQILDTAGDAFIAMDDQGCITAWNEAAEGVFGWMRSEVLGCAVADVMIPPAYRQAHQAGLRRFLATGEARVLGQRLELTALHRDGHEFPVEVTLWALPTENGWSFYTFGRDISERKRDEETLRYQTLHDQLTGLPNRTLLLDRLTQALARADRAGPDPRGPALLFVDLDRFKAVNDSLGHDAGDQLLVAVARRLEEGVRPTDTVARLAGDEFVVLCDGVTDASGAVAAAERLRAALAEPIRLDTDLVHLTASVGIALADDSTNTPEALLQAADVAMYRAKQDGRSRFEIFDEGMRTQTLNRLRTETRLAQAVEHGELRLYYQPVISTDDGRVVGFEALVRWHHPERGLLLPADFIGVAEETGLIVPIGAWVLEEACRQARRWETDLKTEAPLEIAVNLSGRQLAQSDFATAAAAIVAEAEIDPTRVQLCLEITESLLMRDPEATAETLQTLKASGMRLAIDDFGTGYSSLAYLKWFPVDTVKIDRSFVAGIDSNAADRAIVGAVVDLAHALGITVVAEGVETRGQFTQLRSLGCDQA
ncbi:MAG TPA: EAL domain-containing protein, partial [Acidimicrobiia bacterium]|nr:EAL domain-containing protein [Acidimicrobiia bacterium]